MSTPPDHPFSAHLRRASFVGLLAAALLAGLDAGAVAALGAPWLDALSVFGYLVGLYGLVAAGPVLVAAGATRGWASASIPWSHHRLVAMLGACSMLAVITYSAVLWTRRLFQNVELSALLVAVGAALAGALLAGLVTLSERTDGRLRRGLGAVWGVALGAGTAWLVYQNRSGFAQLSGWLLAMPIALTLLAGAALVSARRLLELPRATSGIVAALVTIGLALGATAEVSRSVTPDLIADQAPLGRWLARAVHGVTDWDDDGFSGLLGGGDCAAFDATIAPGRLDVAGDGIDNNCVGGDAIIAEQAGKLTWHQLPPQWPALDVVLLSVETLRADHVGFMGYRHDTTPNLDELARTSFVFERFYASSTYSRLALPSLLTAREPSRIEWRAQSKTKFPRIADANPWLPEAFRNAGYRTGAIIADFPAFTDVDSIGFDRSFEHYDSQAKLAYKGGTMRGFPSREQVGKVQSWLDGLGPDDRQFLWVHFFEPHYLYEQFPGAPRFGTGRKAKYDSEIWGVDKAIGEIVALLRKSGRLERTVIVVVGDHGEEFEEHGKRYHGSNLYEPQVRTPLLIHVPGLAGGRIAEAASTADIAPMLLNLAGLRDAAGAFGGRNMTPRLFGGSAGERPLFLEVWEVKTRGGYKAAAVNWPYKLIVTGAGAKNEELFDLAADPGEQENLVTKLPDVARTMREDLHRYLDTTSLEYR